MGAGPSLRSVLRALKADADVADAVDTEPLVFGMSWERRPVDSSHACGEIEVGFVDVTEVFFFSFCI